VSVALGLVADRYELGEVIGRGRSAVHRARDTRLGRDVAVKQVRVAADPGEGGTSGQTADDVRTRALREARAAARVVSPHAVAVYDVAEEGDAVWLVMELVAAPSLDRVVGEGGPVAEARAAEIGLGVLDALTAAHAQGIVHRDVKPANVLVGTPVKLADFGIAALRDESGLTVTGMVVGSPSYMAPEQASAGAVGPPADMWALGALLYFAVEGEPPFAAGSAVATATAVVHSPPRPQRHPGRLTPLVAALLTKDPRARPDIATTREHLLAVAGRPAARAGAPIASGPVAATGALPGGGGGGAPATTRLRSYRDADDATLTRPGPPRTGRPRRRALRLALAAALAAVAVGAAATLALGNRDHAPPGRTEVRSSTPSTTAPAPAGRSTGTTVAPAPRPTGPAHGKAKGHDKPNATPADAGADDQAADPGTATTTLPTAGTATTVPGGGEPAITVLGAPPPTDPPATDPPAPDSAPPTTVAAAGG
jgi:hypothetical protein